MEEKKTKVGNFFRTFFGSRNTSRIFSTKSSHDAISSLLGIEKGFTLVELLVVVAILGILTAAAMLIINPAYQLQKSRDAKRKSDIKLIQSALELFRSDQGFYPSDSGQTVADCPLSTPTSLQDPNCTTSTYLQTVPKDPNTGNNYYYCASSTCGAAVNGYLIYACLENSSDKDKLTGSAIPSSTIITAMGCPTGTTAYYGVTNP